MDFARKIMQTYGWKDGDGLGKNKDGIAKPLRATFKFDKTGFGADQAASDFNNHWWERIYNEAAKNVNVTEDDNQIKMTLKDDGNSVEISTKGYSMKKLNENRRKGSKNSKSGYENFLQTATLTNLGSEVANHDEIYKKDIEVSRVNVLTDEELFKACGGRTAHKGARHGLKLSGKLLRIEQQEAELLATMNKLETKIINSKNILKKSGMYEKTKTEEKTKGFEIHVTNDILKKKKRRHRDVERVENTFNTEKAIIKSKHKKISCKNTETVKTKVGYLNMDICLKEDIDNEANSVEKQKRKNKKKIELH